MQKTDLEDGMVFACVCSYVCVCVCVRVYEREMTCAYEHQRLFHREYWALYDTNDIYALNKNIYIRACVSACKDFWARVCCHL